MAYAKTVPLTATGAGDWVVPNDFNWADYQITTLGGGADSGGGCSSVANLSPSFPNGYGPGALIPYNVGAAGGDTWFGHASYASACVAAKGGGTSVGGQASAGIGTVRYSGGNCGTDTGSGKGGAGAAAGPSGNGGNGASGYVGSSGSHGGGGGGADGGGNGVYLGAGGTGANGGGSGGASAGGDYSTGAAGQNGSEWGAYGCGGGAGGGGAYGYRGAAGLYGGGGRYGSQGLIVIEYNPIAPAAALMLGL